MRGVGAVGREQTRSRSLAAPPDRLDRAQGLPDAPGAGPLARPRGVGKLTAPAHAIPGFPMLSSDTAEVVRQLAELKLEHRDLDSAIERLGQTPGADELQLRRLKKRKLRIKDVIARLESELIPDLDA